jgi:hypothetical protein
MYYYMDLSKILNQKDQAYMDDDITRWCKFISVIFKRIVFKLKEPEENEIQTLLNQAKEKIEHNDMTAVEQLHECDIRLMKLMNKYKMIFPRGMSYGLDKIDKRYGLGGINDG